MKPKPSRGNGRPKAAWSKILVPTDFSPPSLEALRYARELARERNARLILLHVVEPFHPDWRMDTTTLQRAARDQARHRLDELVSRELPGASAVAEVRAGHPVEQINAVAGKHRADVIVIATHGRTGLQHALLGSVAERVVRHAPCPVLVLRAQAEK
jgi:nucleotide-binding universal stress UspA family protein